MDLGGTNYRVLLVTLAGDGQHPKIDERTYAIPQKNMLGTSKEVSVLLLVKHAVAFWIYCFDSSKFSQTLWT